jgi:signal transduction histidine kinase
MPIASPVQGVLAGTSVRHVDEEPSPRPTTPLHPAYCVIAAPVCALLAVIALVVSADGGPPAGDWTRLALALVGGGAGGVLAVRRRHDRLGPLTLAVAAAGAIGSLAAAFARYGDLGDGSRDLSILVEKLAIGVLLALAYHLLLALPEGRLGSRRRRRGVVFAYAAGLVTAIVLYAQRADDPWWPIVTYSVITALSSLPAAHGRYRRVGAAERRRMQWVGWSFAVVVEVVLVVVALDVLADWPHHTLTITGAASAVIPISLCAGASSRLVTRIDRTLAATVALAGLTTLVIAVYFVVVLGLGRAPRRNERSLVLLSMAAAGVCALLYAPARLRLTTIANRLVYGERVAPEETLRGFGARLTRATPMDELLLQLVESLRRTMAASAAEVWTGTSGRLDLAAAVPHRDPPPLIIDRASLPVVARAGVAGGTWIDVWLPALTAGRAGGSITRVAPIAHAGELLGLIVVQRRADAEPFGEDDDSVLAELARQVGLALHNVQLDSALQASLDELRNKNDELQQSRARIVAAGDAERRKLERNLHDGAQQHLVALAIKARLAADAIDDDPDDAKSMLDELRADIQEAVQELRALAHGIFPPLLMSGGLVDALPAAAARGAIPMEVDVEAHTRYPTEIEAAIYFCCLEAMQNAAKHAGVDATVEIRVWETDTELCFSVADNGHGFDLSTTSTDGHGFVNMRDRLGAFGGTLTIDSAIGRGTTIGGQIPR